MSGRAGQNRFASNPYEPCEALTVTKTQRQRSSFSRPGRLIFIQPFVNNQWFKSKFNGMSGLSNPREKGRRSSMRTLAAAMKRMYLFQGSSLDNSCIVENCPDSAISSNSNSLLAFRPSLLWKKMKWRRHIDRIQWFRDSKQSQSRRKGTAEIASALALSFGSTARTRTMHLVMWRKSQSRNFCFCSDPLRETRIPGPIAGFVSGSGWKSYSRLCSASSSSRGASDL